MANVSQKREARAVVIERELRLRSDGLQEFRDEDRTESAMKRTPLEVLPVCCGRRAIEIRK
jgi:hypothetical protein